MKLLSFLAGIFAGACIVVLADETLNPKTTTKPDPITPESETTL